MLTPIHILKLSPFLFQMLTLSYMYVPVYNLMYLYAPDADPWWTVCLAMVGKFQIAASFAVIYVYAGELMPTVVRSQVQKVKKTKENARKRRHFVTSVHMQAMGISSFVAGIGLLIFPYINSLVGTFYYFMYLFILYIDSQPCEIQSL